MMTTAMKKVLDLVAEMNNEKAKTEYVPVYYKRNGKMIRRSYDDTKYTTRYTELFFSTQGGIRENKIFRCSCCGEYVDYFSLETWLCDFEDENGCICDSCYENEMGDDL